MQTARAFNYLICAAPRTGGALPVQARASAGVADRTNKCFDIYPHNHRCCVQRRGVAGEADDLEMALAAGTAANGVFGHKLFRHQSPARLARLKAARPQDAPGAVGLSHPVLKKALGAPVRHIWLRRRDTLAQAMFNCRASRAGLWRSPVRRNEIERFQPEPHNLSQDPALFERRREWAKSRAKHNADLRDPSSQAHKDGWRRHYFRGVSVRKEPAREHQTKLSLADFIDKRG